MKAKRILCSLFLAGAMLFSVLSPAFTAFATPQRFSDTNFNGAGNSVSANEDIFYDYYEVLETVYLSSVTSYGNTSSEITNHCAPLTGANVCGYYDRWCPNLIPNYATGLLVSDRYYYLNVTNTHTQTCIETLYNLMGTNVGGSGTTQSGFESGLTQYAQNNGYSVTFNSIKNSTTSINFNALANAINDNKIAVFSFSKFNFISWIYENEGCSTLVMTNYNAGHMMVVYGYKIIAYYKDGVNFRTDTYLRVASSFDTQDTGYLLFGSNMSISHAKIVNIF